MDRKIFTLILLIISISSFAQNETENLITKLNESVKAKQRLVILDSLTKLMIKENHPKQLKYLYEFVELSNEQEGYDDAAEKTRFIIQNYMNRGILDSASILIKTALKNKDKFKKKSSEAHLLLKRGAYYYNKELLDSASIDYDKSGTLFLESKDSIFAADARFFAGQVYFDKNNFIESVSRFEEAHVLYEKLGDESYANYTLNELSSLYGKNGFHDKAIYERKRNLNGAKKLNDKIGVFYAYSHLFTSYYKKKELDIAKQYLDSMKLSYESTEEGKRQKPFWFRILKATTKYHLQKNNLDSVSKYLKELEYELKSDHQGEKYHKNDFLMYSAQYNKKKKKYVIAEKFYKELLDKNNRVGDLQMQINANKELSEVLAAQTKFVESYKYLKKYSDAKTAEDSRITTNKFLYYQSEFETQRKDNEIFKQESEIELLEKDKQLHEAKRRNLWLILLSVILLSAVVVYFVWRNSKIKREILAKEIEENKKELESFTKQLIEKSKVQEELTLELEKLKEETTSIKTVDKIRDLTTTKILTSDDWYVFKDKFNKVYPTFFIKLKDRGYKLTKSEERLLAMEKLYLDTNQIATMLAISNDSVVRSRSRLRKKINAPRGSSLLEYLEAS